jgi:N-acetyl-anhydromuramyl-L-alanine amidase AmpD
MTCITCFADAIHQKPILFNEDRIKLTEDYLKTHYGMDQENILINPKMIVLHFTDTDTLDEAFDLFYPSRLGDKRPELYKYSPLNVSAHFLIDRNGTIYQLMPTNRMARHIIGLDYMAIGIENIGGTINSSLTKKQINSNVYLIKKLKNQYPNIRYLIGHYEYGQFRKTDLWKERNPSYFTFKEDPGYDFMKAVRSRIAKLKLYPKWTLPVPKN